MIRFPKPLCSGDTIAITVPSSGVPATLQPRLDLVIAHLHAQGYKTLEGKCLRTEHKDASAPAQARAAELMSFLTDPGISAVMPPWGGELACDLLDLLDFNRLSALPTKWFSGYSDLSTLHVPLTLISGWATAHTLNLMDLAPAQQDPLSASVMQALSHDFAKPFTQHASRLYQVQYIDFKVQVDAAFNLTHLTQWKRLGSSSVPIDFRGKLIGGCLDTIAPLAGSKYADIPAFIRNSGSSGVILYFENCELSPVHLIRTLWGIRRAGWLTGLSGLLIGRNSGPDASSPTRLSYIDSLQTVLADLPFPVLYDLDIGHRPPQLTLINGACAHVSFATGSDASDAFITQSAL